MTKQDKRPELSTLLEAYRKTVGEIIREYGLIVKNEDGDEVEPERIADDFTLQMYGNRLAEIGNAVSLLFRLYNNYGKGFQVDYVGASGRKEGTAKVERENEQHTGLLLRIEMAPENKDIPDDMAEIKKTTHTVYKPDECIDAINILYLFSQQKPQTRYMEFIINKEYAELRGISTLRRIDAPLDKKERIYAQRLAELVWKSIHNVCSKIVENKERKEKILEDTIERFLGMSDESDEE